MRNEDYRSRPLGALWSPSFPATDNSCNCDSPRQTTDPVWPRQLMRTRLQIYPLRRWTVMRGGLVTPRWNKIWSWWQRVLNALMACNLDHPSHDIQRIVPIWSSTPTWSLLEPVINENLMSRVFGTGDIPPESKMLRCWQVCLVWQMPAIRLICCAFWPKQWFRVS